MGTAGGHHVVTGARILLFRPSGRDLRTLERLLAIGTYSEWQFEAEIGELVAHEMGHALGINGHSQDKNDVMFGGVRDPELDYGKWISLADANTLMHAYCGKEVGASLTKRTTQEPPQRDDRAPSVFTPFEGMWTCQVGSEGYDSFEIKSDGKVWPHDGAKAVVAAGGVRFEEPGDGSFFDKRVFELRLVNGQLRGTRTEIGGQFGSGPRVDDYTCTRKR